MPILRINDSKIDWLNSDSHYFFNPRHPDKQKLKQLAKKIPFLKGHIYLFSSGGEKICLLAKEALLVSALAVNQALKTRAEDRWLISLPLFHIGGLSILARAFVGEFICQQGFALWKAQRFQKELNDKKISLSSLVPTQVYDLVQCQLKAPQTLRALIVGGGALSPMLYKKARELNWPVLPSYGLTEVSSQVALSVSSSLGTTKLPSMNILDHIQIKTLRLKTKIKSKSLLTACFDVQNNKLYDPKDSKGWLELPDAIQIKKKALLVKGRTEEMIKISGETVSLQKLSFILEKLSHNLLNQCQLVALPDPRRGFQLVLLTSSFDRIKAQNLVYSFNKKVLAYEKIKGIYFVSKNKTSPFYKTRQKALLKQIGF